MRAFKAQGQQCQVRVFSAPGQGRLRAQAGKRSPHVQLCQQSIALAAAALLTAGAAHANIDKVGEFGASGFIFKDTVEVVAIDDPEVKNVVLYVSEMQRSLTDKIAKNFFNEPSQASITCAVSAPPEITSVEKIKGKDGRELISQGKNISIFQQKALRVRRVYDEERNTVIYIAYSTRMSSAQDEGGASQGRYKTSVCAIPIPEKAVVAQVTGRKPGNG